MDDQQGGGKMNISLDRDFQNLGVAEMVLSVIITKCGFGTDRMASVDDLSKWAGSVGGADLAGMSRSCTFLAHKHTLRVGKALSL